MIEITPSEKSAHHRNKHPDGLKTTTVTQTVVKAGECPPPAEQQVSTETKQEQAVQARAAEQAQAAA